MLHPLRPRKLYHPPRLFFLIFIFTLLFLYLPLLCLFLQPFLKNPSSWMSGFSLQPITHIILNPDMGALTTLVALKTSVELGIASASLSVLIGTMGTVGLYKIKKLPFFVHQMIMLPIVIPEVITGLSLLLFYILCRIPLGFFTVMLSHASFSASFVYFIMNEQFKQIDPQITEAAFDLGAKPKETFFKIVLPAIVPGLMGSWLLSFTLSFDDFLISFFTSGAALTTLPLHLYSLMRLGNMLELQQTAFIMISLSIFLVGLLLLGDRNKRWFLRSGL